MVNLLRKLSPWQRVAVALISFTGSLLLFWFLYGDLTLSLIFMGSIALHELCHAAAFRYYGIKTGIAFFTFLSVTYPAGESDLRRLDNANKMVWTAAAGVIGSTVLASIGCALATSSIYWLVVALLNLYFALVNLAPLGKMTDGAKIVAIVALLRSEEGERIANRLLTIAEVVGILGLALLPSFGKINIILSFVLIYGFASDLSRRVGTGNRYPILPEGLTRTEARTHAFIYLIMVAISVAGFYLLPM